MMLILWRKVPLRGEQSGVGGKDLQHLRAVPPSRRGVEGWIPIKGNDIRIDNEGILPPNRELTWQS